MGNLFRKVEKVCGAEHYYFAHAHPEELQKNVQLQNVHV